VCERNRSPARRAVAGATVVCCVPQQTDV